MIGVDFSGVRNGAEHNAADQYCADRGVFIVENLCNLQPLAARGGTFAVHVYPLSNPELTGSPAVWWRIFNESRSRASDAKKRPLMCLCVR